jgi:outer membrane lipopolysaccharide assembly protein LptE/RlpB
MIFFLLGALLLPACGYHFSVGTGRLPDGNQELVIEQAQNLTAEASAGAWLVAGLRREAARAGLKVGESNRAARLQPRVLSITAIPRGVSVFSGGFSAREQEVVARIELQVSLSSGEKLEMTLSDRQSYLSAPDLRGTEANRQLALRRVIDRLASDGIDRLTRSF